MDPGDTTSIDFAIVFAQGHDRLHSVTQLRRSIDALRERAGELYTPDVSTNVHAERPHTVPRLAEVAVYPNPVRGRGHVEVTVPFGDHWRLGIYDALGRLVSQQRLTRTRAGTELVVLETAHLAQGGYFVRLENEGQGQTVRASTVTGFTVIE